jgi:uncharacterized protein DUF6789
MRIWKSLAAGTAGALAHSGLMYLKARFGLLPSFDPYASLQHTLAQLTGKDVPPLVPWALSFISGATILGFVFGRIYGILPGRSGLAKGLVFGLIGWALLGLLLFPMLGLGLFGTAAGRDLGPAILSLAMLLTYGAAMGTVYAALVSRSGEAAKPRTGAFS